MKKLHFWSIFSLVTVCMLAFSACGDDDDDNQLDLGGGGGSSNKGVVGDWAYMEVSDDQTYLFMESLSLKSSGKFTIVDYDVYGTGLASGGSISSMEKAEYTGTFTAKDGILKLQANGKEQTYSYRVSGDNMTLTSSQLSITYDKMDNDIRTIFSNAEKTYQQRFK